MFYQTLAYFRMTLSVRPNTICAGDNFVHESGVFLYCNIALRKLSISMYPLAPTLSVINRFVVFTAKSARSYCVGMLLKI